MGVVYRAEDTRLGRQVAVKFLSAKLSQDPVALERFQREARAASALNHPHICALYDIGQQGRPAVPGHGAARRHDAAPPHQRPAPAARHAARVSRSQIADALDAAHAPRHRPSRHQVGEHLRHRPRPDQDARLRPGQARSDAPVRTRSVRRHHSWRAGAADRDRPARSARCRTCRPSRRAAKNSTRAPICSRSASCSTRWRPAASRSAAGRSALIFDALLNSTPSAAAATSTRRCPPSSITSSPRRSRRTATSAIRPPPSCAPISSACKRETDSARTTRDLGARHAASKPRSNGAGRAAVRPPGDRRDWPPS